MKFIKRLSPELVSQIAAGEVIERPASAVKELLDNSIDAQAKRIQVHILAADGRSFRVTDDGGGIHPEDLPMAFKLHCTSKISSIEDLSRICTKGFRGEALASIAAVSELSCLSKYNSLPQASRAYFDQNGQLQVGPGVLSRGTSIEVHNLFGRIPARLKFLRRPETELQTIQEIVRELAIAHPEIAFELKNKNKIHFSTSGSGNWEQSVSEVFQEQVPFRYLEAEQSEPPIKLSGLIAPLSFAKSSSNAIITLVNQRPIQCLILRKAIREVYEGLLPKNKYPRLILSLQLPPDQVDVNVHPSKREVRYSAPAQIYALVQRSLEKHLVLHSAASTTTAQPIFPGESLQPDELPLAPPKTDGPYDLGQIADTLGESSSPYRSDHPPLPPISSIEQSNLSKAERERLIKEKLQDYIRDKRLNKGIAELDANDTIGFSDMFSSEGSPDDPNQATEKSSDGSASEPPAVQEFLQKAALQLKYLELIVDLEQKYQPYKVERNNSTEFCLRAKGAPLCVIGQIVGSPALLRESFLAYLGTWLNEMGENLGRVVPNDESPTQVMLLERSSSKPSWRKKLSLTLLETIWRRDGWRCVYCGKHILHPELVRRALREAPSAWIDKLNDAQQLVKVHLLREHQATYDHRLPVSKVPSLSAQEDNLVACCRACNQKKSASTDYHHWQPQQYTPWTAEQEIQIGELLFRGGDREASFRRRERTDEKSS